MSNLFGDLGFRNEFIERGKTYQLDVMHDDIVIVSSSKQNEAGLRVMSRKSFSKFSKRFWILVAAFRCNPKRDFDSWDSVAVINLAMAVEEEYGLTLTAEDIEGFHSVEFVADLVTKSGVDLG